MPARLDQIADDPHLPTLPGVAMQVIQKASRPDCAIGEIASLVSRDPALCAKILKIVNSAFFSIPRAITSIQRALNMLGLRRVRSLVLCLSLPAMQRRPASRFFMRGFWKAAMASAIAAHEWAIAGKMSDPDNELVSSLLGDLGTLVLLDMFPDRYARVTDLAPLAFVRTQCDVERDLFGFDHAELSAHLLGRWGFPPDMTEAIRCHHRPGALAGGDPQVVERAWLLSFAGRIGQLQLAPHEPTLLLELLDLARDRFHLDTQRFIAFLEPLQKKIADLAALLQVDTGTIHDLHLLLTTAAEQLAKLASETTLDNIRAQEEKAQVEGERRRGEEALERLGRQHEIILNSAGEGIFGIDGRGKITFANAAAARQLGRPTDELVGMPAGDLLGQEDSAPALSWEHSVIHEVLCTGETRRVEDGCFRARDATCFPVTYTCAPILEQGAVAGAVVTFRDMTQQRRLEEQLRQAQKMEAVGQLAGGVAHDFNTLLTIILGCGTMLRQGGELMPSERHLVEEILRAGEQAASLTRQLLAFSRKQVLAPTILNLNDVVRGVEKLLRRVIEKNIHLGYSLGAELGLVKADPTQVEQVLMNLCVNARDAMPRGGQLTIETNKVELDASFALTRPEMAPGSYVLLTVSDTGCGMDEATRARIFEPFFTTKGLGKGTGLGLATVYGIVKQSGGHIYVTSEVGQGTSFRIYLPRIEGEAASLAVLPAAALTLPELPSGTETLLVVEDEEGVRSLILEVLRACGYSVLSAGHGGEALPLAEQHAGPIHLLLTDVVMPEMSATELAERLLQLHPEAKVMFMSGYTDDAVVRHGVFDTGTPFLQKPFTPSGLARKVREILDKP